MCMVIDTRTAYKKPFPIPITKTDGLGLGLTLAFRRIIVLINIRMVIAINSAMHPRTLLKKLFGVQRRNLLLYVVVMNWRDNNGVLSYTEAESNIATSPSTSPTI